MHISIDEFIILQKRFQEFRELGYPKLDRKAIQMIELLNGLPNTVTVSCKVPTWDDARNQSYGDGMRSDTIVTVLAVTTREAFEKLWYISQAVYKDISHVRMGYYKRQWPVDIGELAGLDYPAAVLEYNYWDKTEEAFEAKLNRYLEVLESAILSVKE